MVMDKISSLKLNPCISIVLIGEFSVKEQFVSLWQKKEHIKAPDSELMKNLCIVTEHTGSDFDNKTIYCNLWNVSTKIDNTKRHFFSGHVDYCIIICNLRTEDDKKIAEYISLMSTLCPGVDYAVVGFSQSIDDDQRKTVRRNTTSILEYGKHQEFPKFLQLTASDWGAAHALLKNTLITIYTQRKKELNNKFKKLVHVLK